MLAFLSLLGYPIGYLINRSTQEELEQGEQYFKTAYRIILISIALYAATQISFSARTVLGIGIGVISGYFLKEEFIYTGLIAPFLAPLPITALLTIQTTLATTQKKSIHSLCLFAITFLIMTITQFQLIPVAIGALLTRSFK